LKAYRLVIKNYLLRVQSAKFDKVLIIGRLVGYEGDGTIKLILLNNRSIKRFKTVKAFKEDTLYSTSPIITSNVSEGDEASLDGINLGKLVPVVNRVVPPLLQTDLSRGLRDSPFYSDNSATAYDSDFDPTSAETSASNKDYPMDMRSSEGIESFLYTNRPRDVNDSYIDPTVKSVERITRDNIN
jgi:hypothetical protein